MKMKIKSPETLSKESQQYMDDLQKETDRGAALVAAEFINNVVGSLLKAHFANKPNKVDELLSRGGSKVRLKLAYCLGLVGEDSYADLGHIIEIRDIFAHSYKPVNFAAQAVTKHVKSLKKPNLLKSIPELKKLLSNPRDRFLYTAIALHNELLLAGLSQKHKTISK